MTSLLAQEHTIVVQVPDYGSFMHDPGMVVLPSGIIFVASPCWERGGTERRQFTYLSRSRDGGRSWEQLDIIPFSDATPFVARGHLYMFVQPRQFSEVSFMASDDDGSSWSPAQLVFPGKYWNCSTSMVERSGSLYWALNSGDWQGMVAICGDLNKDLTSPGAWRMSNVARRPATPPSLTRDVYAKKEGRLNKYWGADNWLEPNVVEAGPHLRIAARTVVDEQAAAHLACIADINDDGETLTLDFKQFCGWPGGQNKFFIMRDPRTKYYWMLANLVSDSQDVFGNLERLRESGFRGSTGNERRNLCLYYGFDGLNWFPAGMVAQWPGFLQSFMYPSAQIVGEDIVFVSRTSRDARQQHDADLVTFHRIGDFRKLALPIDPTAAARPRTEPRGLPSPDELANVDLSGRWLFSGGNSVSMAAEPSGAQSGCYAWRKASLEGFTITTDGEEYLMRLVGDGTLLLGHKADGTEVWAVRKADA